MDPDVMHVLARAREYLQSGAPAMAEELCHGLLAREPANPAAYQLLGVIAGQAGHFARAAGHFATAIGHAPREAELHRNLGSAYRALGRPADAEGSFRAAMELAPGELAPVLDLGHLLWSQGRLEDAARAFQRAVELQPRSTDARFALASTLSSLGFEERAVALFEDLAADSPDYQGLQVNLGLALMHLGRCEEAIACYDRAIAGNPADHMAHNNRGNALREQQRMGEALASFRRALEIRPDHVTAHSNLLLTLNYTTESQEVIYRESLGFAARHAAALLPVAPAFGNVPATNRVLRVGYLSADFRGHSVAWFIGGVLAAHDRASVRVCCFSSVPQPDGVTAALQGAADEWTSIAGLADAEAADRIRADAIDILVDLGGHTGGNRLMVFARRPAPVQVSWLGYPNTTGLAALDYRLTDAVADPPGPGDALHSEQLVRLPAGFLCYQPAGPSQATLPSVRAGRPELTFGSFNTLAKLGPEVIRVWSQILAQLPASRLLLKSEALRDPDTRRRYEALFGQHGIAADRLELVGWIPDHRRHLELYSGVDVALDPFPYNGTTTTCEALWMGVPVLTLAGDRHAGRVGASILGQVGLPEWVGADTDDYIRKAVAWGMDRQGLAAARTMIATRMRSSPLVDAVRFTRGLEQAYRQMWSDWCVRQRAAQPGLIKDRT